jgi:Tfp pilus assembly protein PilE
MKATRNTRFSRSAQLGITMVEAMIVLIIAAILAAVAYKLFARTSAKNDTTENISVLADIASNLQSQYGRQNQYASITTAIAVQSQVIPKDLRDGGANTATNAFGGAITVAPASLTGPNDSATLTWPNVTNDSCNGIVAGTQGLARRITVAGTVVKPTDGALDTAALAARCDSAARVTIIYDIGRTNS